MDDIVQCDFCNVCKQLDGTHKPVICALWPQGALQAPKQAPTAAPEFAQSDAITASASESQVALRWNKVAGAALFDVYRTTGGSPAQLVEATKLANWIDKTVIGGRQYTYQIRARSVDGRASSTSLTASVAVPLPEYMS
jgi:fibronectin type 3 domain-containing protein